MVRRLFSKTGTYLLVAALSAGLVTLLVLALNCSALGDWLLTLAATAISALFAVAVGLGLFNRQTEMADGQRRQRLIAILEVQAQNTKEILSATKLQTKPVEGVVATQIDPIALDEAVRSGLFSIDDTQLFYYLAAELRMYNFQVGNVVAKGKTDAYSTAWLINSQNKMLERCEQVLARIGQLKG